ncbi:MAG: hypothetical protein K2M48_06395 [Clostridiales bacterium]|nr:hypothetical protein [Clostridiales bacterium]
MKKKNIVIGIMAAAAMSTSLCACSGSTDRALRTTTDIYAMGAVSTVRLLGSDVSVQAVRRLAAVSADVSADKTEAAEGDVVKSQIDKFNEYFTAFDSFLGDDVVTSVSEENHDETYADYETKLTIKGKDISNNTVSYVMYFTETVLKSEVEEDKSKSKYSLEGVMIYSGAEYSLVGKREEEIKRDKTEKELKIRAYVDDKNYVEMEHEYTSGEYETETEYVYSVYKDGKLAEKTAVEFETERKDEKVDAEYTLEFRQGDAKGKYKLERETRKGKTHIKVDYDIGGQKGKFTIRETTSANGEKQYEYTFSDNSTKLCKAK